MAAGSRKQRPSAADAFTEIDVSSAIQLDFKVGRTHNLEVIADDNLLSYVKTEVRGDRLAVYVDGSYSSNLGVKVQATAHIKSLGWQCTSKVTLENITSENFQLKLSGASDCQLNIQADLVVMDLSGKPCGDRRYAKRLTVNCSGASPRMRQVLPLPQLMRTLAGPLAHVKATDQLEAKVSGASILRYAGNPAKLKKKTSGASSISVVELDKAERE